jgi:hypothetical protein
MTTHRDWLVTLIQAIGAGFFALAVIALMEGRAGQLHAALAIVGLVLAAADQLFGAATWRDMWRGRPWGESGVFGLVVGVTIFAGYLAGV